MVLRHETQHFPAEADVEEGSVPSSNEKPCRPGEAEQRIARSNPKKH